MANKIIYGRQCTIIWHVDDLKISHEEMNVVGQVISKLKAEFGNEAPLSITRGKIHDYLGMRIYYYRPGKVDITMIPYIENMLAELPEGMEGTSATLVGSHLLTINNEAPKLSTE
jgi:hypothetical protein